MDSEPRFGQYWVALLFVVLLRTYVRGVGGTTQELYVWVSFADCMG